MAITHRKVTLPNGVRLVLVPAEHSTSVMVRAMVNVGSRHETDEVAGAAHFLEHMLFKGTARRPGAMDINTEISTRGAKSNASTSEDQTEYHVQAASAELPWAMDLICDMVSSPLIVPMELERERGVILEELTSGEDEPASVALTRMGGRLFAGSTLERPVIGYRATVENVTRQQLAAFHALHYHPANLIVVVSGGFQALNAIAQARLTFGLMPPSPLLPAAPTMFAPAGPGSTYDVESMDFEQTHAVLGFRGCAFGRADRPAQLVLSALLGGDICSRLWLEIRETRGLAYQIGAWDEHFIDTGCLKAYGALNADRAVEAVGLIARECASLTETLVPSAEMDRVRSMLRGSFALRFESPHAQAAHFATQDFYGTPEETPQERIVKIMAVTAEEVRTMAAEIFRLDRMAFAATGKVAPVEEYKEALEEYLI